ncbi:MAG: PEP-CTERM sorting domain-containing protein [Fimbriimonadaceae bacterium]|nr:PEP-CTERM sorting domain-containing protein [Fimbriimonadaceae bacterium]
MNKAVSRIAGLAVAVFATVSANAVVFYNVQIQSPPLSTGSSFNTNANSISFFTPNAIVGDPVAPLRSGTLNIQYDADAGIGVWADQVGINLGAAIAGSGFIIFQEQVFELDANNNEVGGPIGLASHVFDANSGLNWNTMIVLDRQVPKIRVKKAFTMSAVDTNVLDLAGVAIVNQNLHLVPEPGTMIALGIGAAALLRRRRK